MLRARAGIRHREGWEADLLYEDTDTRARFTVRQAGRQTLNIEYYYSGRDVDNNKIFGISEIYE